ncbi:histidine kinase [Streptomyces sp. NPDC052682]|uniref:sensor histidine kinase n=1 Tax=Streptomyces sp. NPDC052682 TaxID=3154954 RepID=UPI0034421841
MGGGAGRASVERFRSGARALLRPGPPPRLSRWTWTADVVLAVVLSACTVGAVLNEDRAAVPLPAFGDGRPLPPPPPVRPPAGGPAADPGELVLAALTALPLALRRRCPLTAYGAVLAVTLVLNQRTGAGVATLYAFASCVAAAYSAAVHSPHRLRTLVGLPAGAVLMAVFHEEYFPYFTPGFVPFLVLLGVGLGANAIHTWQQRVRDLQEQQQIATRLAVERERARIARELHDVVTHNVSVMVIQAGAARKVMDAAPGRAREALLAVEAGGRTALAELRHVMGLLTMAEGEGPDPAADSGLAPQPGLAQLTALTDRVRASGVPVELRVTGTPAALPAGADLAAYRVVQEALTNVVKHAAGARVQVSVEHTPEAVRVEVCDTGGTPAAPAGPGGGRGLRGLRERLAVYGGSLDAAERPTGGFHVRAVIPVEERTGAPAGETAS